MANVLLTRRQCRDDDLPNLCAKCGEETDDRVDRRFVWSPSWIIVFFLIAGLPGLLIAYLIARKKMPVRLPVCEKHAGDWGRAALFGWLSVLGSIAVGIIGLAVMDDVGPGLAIAGGAGFVVCLIATAIWNSTLIRPTRIDEEGIMLAGVCREFADETKALRRDADDDEYDDDRPRRKKYNEYDDDRPRRSDRRDRDRYDEDEYDDRRRDRD